MNGSPLTEDLPDSLASAGVTCWMNYPTDDWLVLFDLQQVLDEDTAPVLNGSLPSIRQMQKPSPRRRTASTGVWQGHSFRMCHSVRGLVRRHTRLAKAPLAARVTLRSSATISLLERVVVERSSLRSYSVPARNCSMTAARLHTPSSG